MGARLLWLLAGLLIGWKAYGLWRDYPHANGLGLAIIGLVAAAGLAFLLQAFLGVQKTVYFDLKSRTVDIFHTVLGKTFGKTLDFEQLYRIRLLDIPRARYHPRHWVLEVLLKGRATPIVYERFYVQQAAADTAAELHRAVFGDAPEPWMLEGLDTAAPAG